MTNQSSPQNTSKLWRLGQFGMLTVLGVLVGRLYSYFLTLLWHDVPEVLTHGPAYYLPVAFLTAVLWVAVLLTIEHRHTPGTPREYAKYFKIAILLMLMLGLSVAVPLGMGYTMQFIWDVSGGGAIGITLIILFWIIIAFFALRFSPESEQTVSHDDTTTN